MRQRRAREDSDPFCRLDERFFEWEDNWEDAANAYAERIVVKRRR